MLKSLLSRKEKPRPWVDTKEIPWYEPEFSKRMLREHLADHDAASRRRHIIDAHVDYLLRELDLPCGGSVLDITCGPGLYAERIAERGYPVVGVDFSPASIEYARKLAEEGSVPARFIEMDVRNLDFENQFDGAIFLWDQLNEFTPADTRQVLGRIHRALRKDARLIVEAARARESEEDEDSGWWTSESSVFGDYPQLVLEESFFYAEPHAWVKRWYVINLETGDVSEYSQTTTLYTLEDYKCLMEEAGFAVLEIGTRMCSQELEELEHTLIVACKI